MLEIRRITSSEDQNLLPLIELYISSFPEEERRDINQLKKLIDTAQHMYLNAVMLDDRLAGFFIYWMLDDFYYLEHLAVQPDLRNQKLGARILAWIEDNLDGIRLLEVEPDDNEMAARRIGYYQRNNYKVLTRDYIQPSYRAPEDACALWIMGNRETDRIESYIEAIKENIYRRPLSVID